MVTCSSSLLSGNQVLLRLDLCQVLCGFVEAFRTRIRKIIIIINLFTHRLWGYSQLALYGRLLFSSHFQLEIRLVIISDFLLLLLKIGTLFIHTIEVATFVFAWCLEVLRWTVSFVRIYVRNRLRMLFHCCFLILSHEAYPEVLIALLSCSGFSHHLLFEHLSDHVIAFIAIIRNTA